MRYFIVLMFLNYISSVSADTMDNYMNIYNSISQMEIKAEPQAQAWARSARNILIITNESIAETLLQANEIAKTKGQALFCLPPAITLDATNLGQIILEAYRNISSQQTDKNMMTISQVAWIGVITKYPCQKVLNNKLN